MNFFFLQPFTWPLITAKNTFCSHPSFPFCLPSLRFCFLLTNCCFKELLKKEREKVSTPPNDYFYPTCYATAYKFSNIMKKTKLKEPKDLGWKHWLFRPSPQAQHEHIPSKKWYFTSSFLHFDLKQDQNNMTLLNT